MDFPHQESRPTLRVFGIDLGSLVQQEASGLRVRVGCGTVQGGLTCGRRMREGCATEVQGGENDEAQLWKPWPI